MGRIVMISILMFVIGYIVAYILLSKKYKKKISVQTALSNKHLALFILMQRWMKQKIKGKEIAGYLKQKKIKTVAIYGMNYVGDALLDDLMNSEIEVLCGIDMNAARIFAQVPVQHPDEEIPEVDAIIVTAINAFGSIEERLQKKTKALILSIEDIIYEM